MILAPDTLRDPRRHPPAAQASAPRSSLYSSHTRESELIRGCSSYWPGGLGIVAGTFDGRQVGEDYSALLVVCRSCGLQRVSTDFSRLGTMHSLWPGIALSVTSLIGETK